MPSERLSGRSDRQPGVLRTRSPVPSLSSAIAWLVASMLVVSLGAGSALNPTVGGLLIFGAGVLVLLGLPIPFTVAGLVLAFVLPLTQLSLAVDTRLLAPALLLPLTVKAWGARHDSPGHDLALRLVPLCLLAIASITWSQDVLATGAAALALAALIVCLVLIPASTDSTAILHVLRQLMGGLIIASAAVAMTPIGQLAGRSRGIFANPNALAVLLVLAFPLLMRGRWRLLLPVVFILAFTTASRGGMAALFVGTAFYVLSAGTSRVVTRVLAILLVGAALTLAIMELKQMGSSGLTAQTSERSAFRYENSREFEWSGAIQIWRDHPLIGQGFGASDDFETGNSYLKLLVDLGLLGLVVALPLLLLLARLLLMSTNPIVVATTAAALVSSFFEAWLLTAGSAFFLVFGLVIQIEEMGAAHGRHDS